MEQTWTGRSGAWIQAVCAALGVIFAIVGIIVMFTLNVSQADHPTGTRVIRIMLGIVVVGLLLFAVWGVAYFRPTTVTVTDQGCRIRHGLGDNSINFADIDTIAHVKATVTSAPGIYIYPREEFLTRTGSSVKPGKSSPAWTLQGTNFTDAQMKELLPVLVRGVENAGGSFYTVY
ncbi:MAG: hypothetical protein FWD80_04250 [Propionibacteriaceae bacterium]|nr:hypothetical protein [Propionibacteriaceae bacterium]